MTDRVYTIGYSGRKPEEIKQLLKDHDAVLFDIRFSPRSRVPYWNAGPFRQLLGDSYRHVKELGNKNFKDHDAGIELVDFEAGVALIAASKKPVFLMCGCPDPEHCHRTAAAALLRERGYDVEEVAPPEKKSRKKRSAGVQLPLF